MARNTPLRLSRKPVLLLSWHDYCKVLKTQIMMMERPVPTALIVKPFKQYYIKDKERR